MLEMDFRLIREDVAPTIEPIEEYSFVGGEKRTLAIQLLNKYNGKPFLIPALHDVSITLQTDDPLTPLVKTMTIDATDRSVITVVLTNIETDTLISGSIRIDVVETADATNVMIVIKRNLFRRVRSDADDC